MAIAKINIPSGISVEIEGAPHEITAVLENVRSGESVSPVSASFVTVRGRIPNLIATLKSEEFFQTPQIYRTFERNLRRWAITIR
jgi:hypothetical protein